MIFFLLLNDLSDEWENFLERMESDAESAELLQKTKSKSLELRFWVSYRGQTLARTGRTYDICSNFIYWATLGFFHFLGCSSAVRGMMYYRKALILQAYLERKELGGLLFGPLLSCFMVFVIFLNLGNYCYFRN